MATRSFDSPVRVITESGSIRDVATPFEAYTFLAGRKEKRFDLGDAMLRRMCSAASMGLVKTGTARDAFARYAAKRNILAPEVAAADITTSAQTDPNLASV